MTFRILPTASTSSSALVIGGSCALPSAPQGGRMVGPTSGQDYRFRWNRRASLGAGRQFPLLTQIPSSPTLGTVQLGTIQAGSGGRRERADGADGDADRRAV